MPILNYCIQLYENQLGHDQFVIVRTFSMPGYCKKVIGFNFFY